MRNEKESFLECFLKEKGDYLNGYRISIFLPLTVILRTLVRRISSFDFLKNKEKKGLRFFALLKMTL
jgi:hypothetical protein